MADLLRIPATFRSVDDALGVAEKLKLDNVIILSERPDGTLVFLTTEMSMAESNWLLERTKALLLAPDQPMRPTPTTMGRDLGNWEI